MVSGSIKKILCGVLLWSALGFSTTLVDRVVASVNSEPILESDLKMGMLFYEESDREEIVKKLIDNMLLYQFLVSRGLQVPSEFIEESIQNIARANRTTTEGIAQELARENLTLRDLRRFLERELLSTHGLYALLEREIGVSEVELELQRLKTGVKFYREVELLVVERKDERRLKDRFDPGKSLETLARELRLTLERLRVEKGDLVEPLDREIWRAKVGDMVFAEDSEHIYLARIVSEGESQSTFDREQLRQSILAKKIEERKKELLERLRKNSFIKIVQ